MSSSNGPLLLAGSALLVAGLGYLAVRGSSSGSSSKSNSLVVADLDEIDDDDGDDAVITADEVAKIFDRLFREMSAIFGQLMQQIHAIQMSGQHIPEAQLRIMLKNEMERALAVKQKLILEEFGMDYDCWEEATWEFLQEDKADEYPAVKMAVLRFQKFWENISGEEHAGYRPGGGNKQGSSGSGSNSGTMGNKPEPLDATRLLEVSQGYFDALTDKMKELVAAYKAAGKDLKNDIRAQNDLNMEFAVEADKAGQSKFLDMGTTQEQFELSIKHHADNPAVARELHRMQQEQQRQLAGVGSV